MNPGPGTLSAYWLQPSRLDLEPADGTLLTLFVTAGVISQLLLACASTPSPSPRTGLPNQSACCLPAVGTRRT
jgi:hypothetical protein